MRQLFDKGYHVGDHLLRTFTYAGRWLAPGTRILDFGCGSGGLVYRFRELGLDAYGFDIHERVDYADPEDRRFFGFIANPTKDTSNHVVDRDLFRLPFEDDFFDVVVSTSVIEHVIDLPRVMAEIARVLRPDGFAFHVYPKRSILIEPHMYVPLGSRLQKRWWFYLWAYLGVRNDFQDGLDAKETAENNVVYARTGLKYHSAKALRQICLEYFDEVEFYERYYYQRAQPNNWFREIAKAWKTPQPLRTMSPQQRLGGLWTARKRTVIPERRELTSAPAGEDSRHEADEVRA
jgi:SAM-dependent methyltransferase